MVSGRRWAIDQWRQAIDQVEVYGSRYVGGDREAAALSATAGFPGAGQSAVGHPRHVGADV